MRICPNCGVSIDANARLCPNCGAVPTVWPPSPNVTPPLPPLRPRTLTGRVWTDFLLGAVVQYLLHLATARVLLVYGLPPAGLQAGQDVFAVFFLVAGQVFWAIVLGLAVYYGLRRAYPFVARGSGYTTLALLVILLGAFFTCRPVLY